MKDVGQHRERPRRGPLLFNRTFIFITALLAVFTQLPLKSLGQPAAFVNPDYYFDFSQIRSSTTADFVLDQVTKNPMNSFTFEAARSSACPGSGLLAPQQGPDGLVFSQEKQSIRLQYADNVDLRGRWMVALWIKAWAGVPTPRNETLLTQARYDNRNETPHAFSIGLMSNPTAQAKLGLRFSAFLYNETSTKYQYVEAYYQNKLDIQDGWVLLVVGLDDVLDPTKTTVYFKMRSSATNNKEYTSFDFTGLKWVQRSQDKQDIYLGAFCDLFSATKVYGNPFRGTISRLYIWRDIQIDGVMGDYFLDRYFFRVPSSLASPTCTDGAITGLASGNMNLPCKYCIVGFNPTTNLATAQPLSCLSEDKSLQQMFIAYWDFNDAPVTQQYFEDKTGNGYHLYKGTPIDIEPNEPFKVQGQGYLFEMNMFAQAMLPILLHNYPGFTFDIWIRRESPNPASATNSNAFAFLIDRTVASVYNLDFGIQISDVNSRIYVTMNNIVQQSPQYTNGNLFKDTTWNYYAVSIYRYQVGAAKGCRIRFMANLENLNSVINCVGYTGLTVSSADTMTMQSYKNYIVRKARIFAHAMSVDELPNLVKTAANSACVKKLGQNQCTICPEDGKCITTCNQNQFENAVNETCDSCHQFCGGCYAAGKDSCNYCTRNTASQTYYSQQYGNCTCKTGYYYNVTTDNCESCDMTRCSECFGPTKTECLTCATSMIFYPPTFCVDNCDDPLVKGNGEYGYFKGTEIIAGAGAFDMCIKCHPYCTACYGTQNGQCTSCQDGYFLESDECIDNCPDFQFPDMSIKACAPCHPDCIKCTSNAQNKCTKCYEAKDVNGNVIQKKYLQNGWCKNQCDAGFYSDSEQVCQPCHQACSTCTSPRNTTCGSCNSGYFLEWLGFACKYGCDDGKYGDSATNMCLLCHYSCKTCRGAGPDQCTICTDGYFRRKSLCVSKCEEGEFIVDGACFSCDKKCMTCFGPKDDQCYTCADNTQTGLGYYYYGNKCMTDCPSGFYPDNFEKVCKPCKTVCSACTSWDFCTACIDGPYQLNNGECTFFQCMDTQYLAVKPTLACYDCDSTCLTCQGMSKFDCLSCKPSDKFYDQTCLTCKDQPGMTNAADPSYPGCVEICGDGFNFGMLECDDGNLVNGDGCDSKCFVEKGWSCSGGSMLMPDSCVDIKSPTPKISLINKKNQIFISFDEEVVLTENIASKTNPKFTISIVGNQPSYKFDWGVQSNLNPGDHIQNFVIDLKFYQSLRGSEKITIRFLNSHTFEDDAGNGIVLVPLQGLLSEFAFRDPYWSNVLDGIGDYVLIAIVSTGMCNVIAAQYYSASTTSFWTLIAYLQMITLVPLVSVNWPMFVDTFFGELGSSLNGEFVMLPNVIFDNMIAPSGKKTILEPPLNERYSEFDHEYSNFFYLAGRKILLWGILFMSYPFIWYLKRNYADKHKFCKLWEKLELRFRFTFLLRGILLSYLSMVLASTLNIYKMQFANVQTTISCFVSIAFQISMIYLPILIMNILQRNYDKMGKSKFSAQYSTIVDELDLSHPSKYMYYAVFLMRRIIFVFLLVLFANTPLVCMGSQCAAAVFMILYIIIARPFKRRMTTALTIIGELFLIGFFIVGLGIMNPDQPDTENEQFGFLIILIFGVILAIGFLCIIIQVAQDLVTEFKERSQRSKAELMKENADQKYKKWKKRKQLVKREGQHKEKQKLLDQHEEIVNQYRRQIEEEEEKNAREEEERERMEEEEYGQENYYNDPNMSQAYMMHNNYDNSYLVQEQILREQQKMLRHQQRKNGGINIGPETRNVQPSEVLKLNKNSGGSSGEALNQEQQQMEEDEQNNYYYGDEYDYGEEQQEQQNATSPKQQEQPEEEKEAGPTEEDHQHEDNQAEQEQQQQEDDNEAADDDGLVEEALAEEEQMQATAAALVEKPPSSGGSPKQPGQQAEEPPLVVEDDIDILDDDLNLEDAD